MTKLESRIMKLEAAAGTGEAAIECAVERVIDENGVLQYSILQRVGSGERLEVEGPGRMCARLRAAGFDVPDPLPGESANSYCKRRDEYRAALVAAHKGSNHEP